MHFVYIVECSDKSYYIGISYSLDKRIAEHNSGNTKYTKGRIPVKLVYFEKFNDKIQAAKIEREIKGWSRIKKRGLIESLHRVK